MAAVGAKRSRAAAEEDDEGCPICRAPLNVNVCKKSLHHRSKGFIPAEPLDATADGLLPPEEQQVVITPCGHCFHRGCLRSWLHVSPPPCPCPVCRTLLDGFWAVQVAENLFTPSEAMAAELYTAMIARWPADFDLATIQRILKKHPGVRFTNNEWEIRPITELLIVDSHPACKISENWHLVTETMRRLMARGFVPSFKVGRADVLGALLANVIETTYARKRHEGGDDYASEQIEAWSDLAIKVATSRPAPRGSAVIYGLHCCGLYSPQSLSNLVVWLIDHLNTSLSERVGGGELVTIVRDVIADTLLRPSATVTHEFLSDTLTNLEILLLTMMQAEEDPEERALVVGPLLRALISNRTFFADENAGMAHIAAAFKSFTHGTPRDKPLGEFAAELVGVRDGEHEALFTWAQPAAGAGAGAAALAGGARRHTRRSKSKSKRARSAKRR
jgi:hypothetical protein